jgi:hypothetical protein
MMEAVRTSETSVDNHFTRQYNQEDSSEHHTRRRENLKSHNLLPAIYPINTALMVSAGPSILKEILKFSKRSISRGSLLDLCFHLEEYDKKQTGSKLFCCLETFPVWNFVSQVPKLSVACVPWSYKLLFPRSYLTNIFIHFPVSAIPPTHSIQLTLAITKILVDSKS